MGLIYCNPNQVYFKSLLIVLGHGVSQSRTQESLKNKQASGTNLFLSDLVSYWMRKDLCFSSITSAGATSLHSHVLQWDTDVCMHFSIFLVFSGILCMEISSFPPLFWSKDSRRTGIQMRWSMNIKYGLHSQPRKVKWLLSFH